MRTVPLSDILQLCDLEKRAFSNTAMRTLQHAGIGAAGGAVAGGAYGAYTAAPGQGWQGAARGAAVGGALGGGAAGLGSYMASRTAGKAITGLRGENAHLGGRLDDAHAGLRQHQLAHEGTLADLTEAQRRNVQYQGREAEMAATLRDKTRTLEEQAKAPVPHQKVQGEIDDFLAAARSNPGAAARTPDIRSDMLPGYNQSGGVSGVRRRDTPESRAATVMSPRPAAPPVAMPGAMRPPGTPPPLPIRGRTAGFEQAPPQVRTAALKLASLGIGGAAGLGALTTGTGRAIEAYRAQPEGERDWEEIGKAGLRGAIPGAIVGGGTAALLRSYPEEEAFKHWERGHADGLNDQRFIRDALNAIPGR